MPFNGAGVFSRTPGTRIANQGALVSAQVNDETDNLVNGVNGKLNLDGLLAMTGNLPLVGDGTAAVHAATIQQVQKGVVSVAASVAGTVDAITIVMAPVSTAYTTKEEIIWVSGGANTITTPTINKDGIGAKTIVAADGTALAVGALGASGVYNIGRYDGTNVRLVSSNTSGAALLASANVFTASPQQLKVTTASVASGPTVELFRDRAAPANADEIGSIIFTGRNSVAAKVQYGRIGYTIDDVVTLTEDAHGYLNIIANGVETNSFQWGLGISSGTPTGGLKGIGTVNAQASYYQNGVSFGPAHVVVVKTSGTSYTTPVGCTQISVEVIGGGNSGAGGSAGLNSGGGGAGGGYAKKLYPVLSNTAYTYAVGGAGGGNSTFTDGVTLITGNGGAVGSATVGGAGGTGTNGDINISGAAGSRGTTVSSDPSGNGGASGLSYGAGGVGVLTGTGTAGSSYGGGGSGGGYGATSGGAGAAGVVIITEYY